MTAPAIPPPAAGTPPNPAGSGNGEGQGGETPKPGNVPYETHRQLLDEKKRSEARLRELEAQNAERERKELEAKGDFEKLLKQERERSEALFTELKSLREQETGRRKLASVLGALQGNVDKKFYNLIPFEDVVIDPTTGNVDDLSVANVVERVRATYPEIIKPIAGPMLPTTAPQGGTGGLGKIKRSEFLKLSTAEMRKWKPDQVVPD